MKKLFGKKSPSDRTGRNSNGDKRETIVGVDTLARLHAAKEQRTRKWQETEQEHQARLCDHQLQLVELEEQELSRRQSDLASAEQKMAELRGRHSEVESRLQCQIELIRDKLVRCQTEHSSEQQVVASQISDIQSEIGRLQSSLDERQMSIKMLTRTQYDDMKNNDDDGYVDVDRQLSCNPTAIPDSESTRSFPTGSTNFPPSAPPVTTITECRSRNGIKSTSISFTGSTRTTSISTSATDGVNGCDDDDGRQPSPSTNSEDSFTSASNSMSN